MCWTATFFLHCWCKPVFCSRVFLTAVLKDLMHQCCSLCSGFWPNPQDWLWPEMPFGLCPISAEAKTRHRLLKRSRLQHLLVFWVFVQVTILDLAFNNSCVSGVALPSGAVQTFIQQWPRPAGRRMLGLVLPLRRPQWQDPSRHRLWCLQAPCRAAHVSSDLLVSVDLNTAGAGNCVQQGSESLAPAEETEVLLRTFRTC